MAVFCWIISKLTNLLCPIGIIIALCLFLDAGEFSMWIAPICAAVLGLIFGFVSWQYDVAPRMFWVKSRFELFDSRVGAALGSAVTFFFSGVSIEFLVVMLVRGL